MSFPARTLPVIDMRRLDPAASGRAEALGELRRAARDPGFFYLTGHGVRSNKALLALARRFFALPAEEKRSVGMIGSPHFRGYTEAGDELTRGARDWREQFDVNSERERRWRPGDPAWMRLQGPNQWPAALPELKDAILTWQAEATQTAIRLLSAFAEALGAAPDAFAAVCRAPNQHVKIIRYPGFEDGGQGVGPHKDSGLLTFVLQDGVGGLAVETAEGAWIEAAPLEGSFVVNVGELLELASNGYLRATMHKVAAPPAGRERFSAAFFLGASLESEAPLIALPPELAAEARGVETDPRNPLLKHAGENYLKGRLRSHPDVAARYYGDVA